MIYGNYFIRRVDGPSSYGKFHGPRDRMKEREVSILNDLYSPRYEWYSIVGNMLQIFFIGMLRDMAWRVKLPKHESALVRAIATCICACYMCMMQIDRGGGT